TRALAVRPDPADHSRQMDNEFRPHISEEASDGSRVAEVTLYPTGDEDGGWPVQSQRRADVAPEKPRTPGHQNPAATEKGHCTLSTCRGSCVAGRLRLSRQSPISSTTTFDVDVGLRLDRPSSSGLAGLAKTKRWFSSNWNFRHTNQFQTVP